MNMFKHFFCFLVISLLIVFSAQNSWAEIQKQKTESYDSKKLWAAVPASYLIGFGSGHYIQGRFAQTGKYYAAIDAIAWIVYSHYLPQCRVQDISCRETREDRLTFGRNALMISHYAQLFDSSIWGYKYYLKNKANESIQDIHQASRWNFTLLPELERVSLLVHRSF
jgi:hypothetical protein